MKKKVLVTVFSMVALVSLAACSNDSKTGSSSSKTNESTEQTSTVESSKKTEETSSSKEAESSIKETESSATETKSDMGNDTNFSLMIEASQSQIPAIKEQAGDAYKDISIEEGKDSTVIYNYQFAQKPEMAVDAEAMKPTMVKGMKPTIDQMKGLFPDVKIQVNYLNPDGSEVASFTITQEDTDKIEE